MTEQEILSEQYSDLKVRYWELVHGINNKGIVLQVAVLEDRIAVRDKEIQHLKDTVRDKNVQIGELKKQVVNIPVPGSIIVMTDKEMGNYVPQKTHQLLVERIKMLQDKYDSLWLECKQIKQ